MFSSKGHQGKDRRFYVIDFSRLFPCTTPTKNAHPKGFLYQLFRPEFIINYKKAGHRWPLCSDAYTYFSVRDSNYVEFMRDIDEATHHLLYVVVPGIISCYLYPLTQAAYILLS